VTTFDRESGDDALRGRHQQLLRARRPEPIRRAGEVPRREVGGRDVPGLPEASLPGRRQPQPKKILVPDEWPLVLAQLPARLRGPVAVGPSFACRAAGRAQDQQKRE